MRTWSSPLAESTVDASEREGVSDAPGSSTGKAIPVERRRSASIAPRADNTASFIHSQAGGGGGQVTRPLSSMASSTRAPSLGWRPTVTACSRASCIQRAATRGPTEEVGPCYA